MYEIRNLSLDSPALSKLKAGPSAAPAWRCVIAAPGDSAPLSSCMLAGNPRHCHKQTNKKAPFLSSRNEPSKIRCGAARLPGSHGHGTPRQCYLRVGNGFRRAASTACN